MRTRQTRFLIFAPLAALLAVFAGCKAESPTAPPPVTSTSGGGSGGTSTSGGVTPPVGASLTLTANNTAPLTNSIVTLTATVTQNGQPVPNGTAVEFNTDNGQFTDVSATRTIRTTTNGVATASLTLTSAGVANVTATVNNVTKSIQITFSDQPITPPKPSTAPTISSVTPNTGLPAGGTTVTITGSNFRPPVRVLVNAGPAGVHEAFVNQNSVTPTQFTAVMPAINLATTQTQAADITVIVDAGNPTQEQVTKTGAFTYVNPAGTLVPVIRTLSPTSGPIDGGTRVTIVGDAFDVNGVQVFFGNAQAQVISVNFNQIIVLSPTGRDTSPNAGVPVTGPIDVKVINVTSGKSVTSPVQFRYVPKMQLTLIGPNQGPFTGGTRFTIDGTGFNEPLAVTLAGVAATVIKVTGTEITGISNGVVVTGCNDVTGPVVVTNGDNGDSATGLTWIYRVAKPTILSVSGPINPGGTVSVIVANAVDPSRFTIASASGGTPVTAPISGETQNANGTTTFLVTVPFNVTLATQTCPSGGTSQIPTNFNVTYTSVASSCTDTLNGGLIVNPPAGPILTFVPNGFGIFNAVITPACPACTPPTPASVAPSASQTVNITNTGNLLGTPTPLTISNVSTAGQCSNFTLVLPTVPQTLNPCDSVPIVARYNGQTSASSETCTVTVTTNAGTKSINLTGVSSQ
jgi:hypothetical protein